VKVSMAALGYLLLFAASAYSAQDAPLLVRHLSVTGTYKMEPESLSILPCWNDRSCDFPAYEGVVTIEAETSENGGYLTRFDVEIDGKEVHFDLVKRFGALGDFMLSDLRITHSSGYDPVPVREAMAREGVFPVIPPFIAISDLEVRDPTCEFDWRVIRLKYFLEDHKVEVSSNCYAP
jgi:hypothetical protein